MQVMPLETVEEDSDKDEEIDYAQMMIEGTTGIRKRGSSLDIESVSDSDVYDKNYNQYYETDLGDEADKNYERLWLL